MTTLGGRILAAGLWLWLLAAAVPARAEDAWIQATVPASAEARFDIGRIGSANISASITGGGYFVTDLGEAPSGTFRRIRNGGANSIPFVMDGKRIVGFAPSSPAGGPGGSGGSRVLPVAPGEVVEFVSLGAGAWQLVQYLPLGMMNFGLLPGIAALGISPTASPPANWFQLGPVAGAGPEPDYPFAVNWGLHGGKLHTHGLYLMLPGDTPNIELRQADIDPADESPRPWTRAPYLGAHISGRALVDIGQGTYAFLNSDQPGTIGYRHGPSFLYQGFTANIDLPITEPPTRHGTGGALVFKVTPNGAITPFQRGWFSNTGNLVAIGKAAFEACGLAYPYDHPGRNISSADSPCDDADYFDTPGWGNLSLVATDIESDRLGRNAALAVRAFKAHGEGQDLGWDAGAASIDRYAVHEGKRTAVERMEPAKAVLTYPTRPAFRADLSAAAAGHAAAEAVLRFDRVAFDQHGDFDASTGVFTAPVTGVYQLEAIVQLSAPGADRVSLAIVTSAERFQTDAGGEAVLRQSALVRLNAGDTARVVLQGSGAAIEGGDQGRPRTSFSGFLVG